MPGRFAILAMSAAAMASVSGMVLGNYATTTRQSVVELDDGLYSAQQPDDADSDTVSTVAVTDLAPDHVPVCRKGCGPSLYERQSGAYYDSGENQLDRIYATGSRDYLQDQSHDDANDLQTAVELPEPRVASVSTTSPCNAEAESNCATAIIAHGY